MPSPFHPARLSRDTWYRQRDQGNPPNRCLLALPMDQLHYLQNDENEIDDFSHASKYGR